MKLKNILLGLAAIGVLTSCEMDYTPYNSIPQDKSFESVSDLKNLVNGNYALLRSRSNGMFVTYTDIQTDLFNASATFGNRLGDPHKWSMNASSEETSNIWEAYYIMLSNINYVIGGAPKITPTAKESDSYNQMIGEMYFLRAYVYYKLVNLYGKAYYNDGTQFADTTTMGVPLHLNFDIEARLPRASVKATYDQILADLKKVDEYWAKVSSFDVVKFDDSPSRFTPDVLSAFKARVYLSMGDWDNAITQAEAVIGAGNYPLISDAATFSSMWKDDLGTEILMHLYIDENESPRVNDIYLNGYNASNNTYAPDFIPTKGFVDMYESGDIRKTAYFAQHKLSYSGSEYTNIWSFNKFPLTKKFTASGDFQHSPILFRSAELYLISAEAAARKGNTTLALQRLNELRAARGLAAYAGSDVLEAVKSERIKELAGEGFYFYDLKRWNKGVDREAMGAQNPDALTLVFMKTKISAGDNRFVWGIPAYDMNLNVKLKQNPGW